VLGRRLTSVICCALSLAAMAACTSSHGTSSAASYRKVAYFVQWGVYDRQYFAKNVDTSGAAPDLTTINYAFGNIDDNGCFEMTKSAVGDAWADYQRIFKADESVDGKADPPLGTFLGNFNQLKQLKQKYPNLQVLMSLGGWTWSAHVSDAARTPASRQKFVASCIDLFIKGDLETNPGDPSSVKPGLGAGVFDGIDLDWEYPASPGNTGNVYRPEDTANYTALLQEFRRQLDAYGKQTHKHYLLTAAMPASQQLASKIQVKQVTKSLDWANLMTYDYHGTWENTTNFDAPLYASPNDPSKAKQYDVDDTVRYYLAHGMPAKKINLGLPFYGRGWTGVTPTANGLYQPAKDGADGLYEKGIDDYKRIAALPAPVYRDPATDQVWKFDGTTWWTYDDAQVIAQKMAYVKKMGLGGAMAWSLDGDDANATLVKAMAAGLG
jgi:chitinase